MNALEVLNELKRTGCEVAFDGDRLLVHGPLTDELRQAIRTNKPEIIALLRSGTGVHNLNEWPPECLESEKRFGCPEARLYPLLGKEVRTPEGTGTLWQVLSVERVGVVREVDGQERVVYFSLEEVRPIG